MREAKCGTRSGRRLTTLPHGEMRWDAWQELHPTTEVVSSDTGWDRDYAAYPYDLYESAEFTLFPMPDPDRRRFGKERVLGVAVRDGGLAFPFGELANLGSKAVVNQVVNGQLLTVLWDSTAFAAHAYEPASESGPATLMMIDAQFVDQETGSVWTVEGRAVEGPRTGERLIWAEDAFVAYWFAWAGFQPETEIWTAPPS